MLSLTASPAILNTCPHHPQHHLAHAYTTIELKSGLASCRGGGGHWCAAAVSWTGWWSVAALGLRVVVVAVVDAWAGVVIVRDGEDKCTVTLSESGTHQRRVGDSGEVNCTAPRQRERGKGRRRPALCGLRMHVVYQSVELSICEIATHLDSCSKSCD